MTSLPSLSRKHLRRRCAATLLVLCLLSTAACGKAHDGAASIATTTAATANVTTTATPPSAPDAGNADLDVCRLLTDAEVAAIIGDNSGGKGGGVECSWENEDNYHSVTIDIGSGGSAPGGALPDPLPGAKTSAGPDGIRYSSGNVVEFLIGDRACQVQVVTSVADETDRPTAVNLIKLIRSRVKS